MITATVRYEMRKATVDDYDFIYGVASSTMRDHVDRIWGWNEEYQSNQFRENFNVREWQLVMVDGRRAGCLNVRYHDTEIFLANIYLLPEYQRRGIGTSLIQDLKRVGRDTGRPVRLNVINTNHDAYRLYLRLGFHVVEATQEKRLMST